MIKSLIVSLLFLYSNCVIALEAKYSKQIILPHYGSIPRKGETRIEPTTGTKITRLTDASELSGTDDALIVYSRYSPENSRGNLVIVFGSNSTSSWVIERESGNIVTELKYASNRGIGETHEVRWDTSGKNPNKIYFRNGMKFYTIDDVTKTNYKIRLIKDFSSYFSTSDKIYNDVEGDSSNDSDHWAWMAAHYNGTTYQIDGFIHYQISTDTIHILKPKDLEGTSLNHYSSKGMFSKPNMVEVSPLGTGIVLHYGRVWGDETYGNRPKDLNTWFDGAHLWPLNFDFKKITPIKISVGETHSGWSFDKEGNEYFISQNNRTDKIDAVNITKNISAYDNRITVASHRDMGWSNGFHFGKMPSSKPGWVFVSTYSSVNDNTHTTDWGADQFIMFEMSGNPWFQKIYRVSPNYNKFDGEYRDEAAAAINLYGNRIYSTSNWGGMLDHREVFMFEFEKNWDQ